MHVEINGTIDLSHSQYAALDDRRVRVTGSQLFLETYTVKPEGAKKVGYPQRGDRLDSRSFHHPPDRRLGGTRVRKGAYAGGGCLR